MTPFRISPAAAVRGGKWAALAASIYIQCTSGSSYCFGVYSPLLKSSQAYSQSTLDSVAFFKDLGANVGVLSGLLSSSRFGSPWLLLLIGAVLCFAGYFPMWLAVAGVVGRLPVPAMCLFMFLAAQGQTFFNTANVVTAVENFPSNRGTVIGIMKGFLGLSGAILIRIYQTLYNGKPAAFVLMIALLPTLLPLLLMGFVKVYKTNGHDDKRHLDAFSIISLTIAGYLMLVIIGENILTLSSLVCMLTFVMLLLLLLSPLVVAIKVQLRDSKMLHESVKPLIGEGDVDSVEVSEKKVAEEASTKYNQVSTSRVSCVEENLNVLEAMVTCDFGLLFLPVACGLGSGLATLNNISQIGGSLGYTSKEISGLVSLWSIWNFLGRFGVGYISDYFLRARGYTRPLFMVLTLGFMSVGHVIISSGLPGTLYVGSTIVGLSYGSMWVLMPSITSEIFGLKHFGTLFNTIAIASPIGSYILSVRVVGFIYDMESSGSSMQTCIGRHCFMLSFLIMASTCVFGLVIALSLFFRTRRFYGQVICSRLRNSVAL